MSSSQNPPTSDPLPTRPDGLGIGSLVNDKYRIIREIGRGGMGAVYEAQNVAIGKKVALKFIDHEAATNADAVQRFVREAQAASAAESMHIVQVFDVGECPHGTPYIVMELLRGETLAGRLSRMRQLPVSEAVHVCVHALRGLRRAHEVGIVHRDLKPDNIFLVETDDDPIFGKVVDFGISKIIRRASELDASTLTRQGVILGTPYYMSPEQAQGMPDLDARTDLWAVGAILNECLTGQRPHVGNTYEQVIVAICTTDVPDIRSRAPWVPQNVADVIRRALTRDREQRYQSASEFIDALRGVAPDLLSANPPTPDPQAAQALRSADLSAKSREAPSGARTRVSWTTGALAASDPPAAARSHRMLRVALVGLGAMIAAFGLTLVVVRSARPRSDGAQGVAAGAPSAYGARADVQLHVTTNVPGARIVADDRELPDGIVRAPPGKSVRLKIEADGYATVQRVVAVEQANDPLHILLDAVVAAADAAASTVPRARPAPTGAKAAGAGPRPQQASDLIELPLKKEYPR
jgi:eukaryotic-like serine/threonine-protein kinase